MPNHDAIACADVQNVETKATTTAHERADGQDVLDRVRTSIRVEREPEPLPFGGLKHMWHSHHPLGFLQAFPPTSGW
ncbi:hypothetical protein GCM10020220_104840 [Nonomuraea rubra]